MLKSVSLFKKQRLTGLRQAFNAIQITNYKFFIRVREKSSRETINFLQASKLKTYRRKVF
jgi:hypothetical protein